MTTKLVAPTYELPDYRFLQGLGELKVGSNEGPATTIWELLIHFDNSQYPVDVEGKIFTKYDLLIQAAQVLAGDRSRAVPHVGEDDVSKIWEMCRTIGVDPDSLV